MGKNQVNWLIFFNTYFNCIFNMFNKLRLGRIFSKFFRATNAIKLETEGTGLGLFIVKNIIEKHNGKISVKSKEGKGTEISFFIPIVQNIK